MPATGDKKQASRFDLPGLTLPLDWKPDKEWDQKLFPNAIDPDHVESYACCWAKTTRELTMMRIMNAITDKPEWERKVLVPVRPYVTEYQESDCIKKVFDKEITSKWKAEVSSSGQDVTRKMLSWIFGELEYKAELLKKTGMVALLNPGVIASDSAISKELQNDLRMALLPLEEIPEDEKDYHPGSDRKVIDLVHPSLFPVIYGRTQCLQDEIITIDNCWAWSGEAKVLAKNPRASNHEFGRSEQAVNVLSKRFQWLPCDVEFGDQDGKLRIVSYVNNLHPEKHARLYPIIEKIIDKAIPLWNLSLLEAQWEPPLRIPYETVEYMESEEPTRESDEDEEDFWERLEEWEQARPLMQPEPEGKFSPRKHARGNHVDLRESFRKSGLQVIVKLANIELTPESPRYDGGTWHVEGQLNERICATALYYYSNDNITHSSLSFRQRAHSDSFFDLRYEQSRHEFLQSVYGFATETQGQGHCPITQNLGDVSCVEGRLLTFPNKLQHRVAPFELADKTKPGHRKILALFLVDPHMRIISSANVPPQRADWWEEKLNLRQLFGEKGLPLELQQMVLKGFDSPLTMDEAKEYRLELMQERTAKEHDKNDLFEMGDFSLCEH